MTQRPLLLALATSLALAASWAGGSERNIQKWVDKNGVAQIRFKPVDRAAQVKAFAISLEREGGVPKKEGPILLVGTS